METLQLKALVSRWQRAYETLEAQHLETCSKVQEAVEKELQQLQEEKRFHLVELDKLQKENTTLREENAALQDRERRLIEHNAMVYRQNEKLREVLMQTRDAISAQATPASSVAPTPPMQTRGLADFLAGKSRRSPSGDAPSRDGTADSGVERIAPEIAEEKRKLQEKLQQLRQAAASVTVPASWQNEMSKAVSAKKLPMCAEFGGEGIKQSDVAQFGRHAMA
jgi:hypothetical protein